MYDGQEFSWRLYKIRRLKNLSSKNLPFTESAVSRICRLTKKGNYNMEHDGIKLVSSDRNAPVQFQRTQMISAKAPVGPQITDLNDGRVVQMQGPLLGPENTVTTCQFCHASIKTAVKYTTTSRTHMAAALWGMICCLCCVPYGAESAKNSDHYCPACQRYLGTYVK